MYSTCLAQDLRGRAESEATGQRAPLAPSLVRTSFGALRTCPEDTPRNKQKLLLDSSNLASFPPGSIQASCLVHPATILVRLKRLPLVAELERGSTGTAGRAPPSRSLDAGSTLPASGAPPPPPPAPPPPPLLPSWEIPSGNFSCSPGFGSPLPPSSSAPVARETVLGVAVPADVVREDERFVPGVPLLWRCCWWLLAALLLPLALPLRRDFRRVRAASAFSCTSSCLWSWSWNDTCMR